MAKSTRKSTKSQAADKPASRSGASGGDKLVGSVWHNGKSYDPKSASDQAAFKKLVADEEKLGDKNKDGSPRAQLDLQSLADQGVVSGFGTKASKKSKKAADEFDEDEMEEGDTPAGGGVDAVEEQDLMEEEQEMQDEDR